MKLLQTKIKSILFILLFIIFNKGSYSQEFYLGVDLSYVNELQDSGVKYFSADAVETDPFELLANKGANLVRLRLWHNPEWTNYSNLNDVKKSIARAKANGQAVLLDFHYSDFWVDPSRQWRPAAWNSITDDAVLGESVFNYT
jgi:arabinogalactan endo-1,4-beta-galactosidase